MKTRLMKVKAGALGCETFCYIPADRLAFEDCEQAKHGFGKMLEAELRLARNPGYHRMTHALGRLVCDNVEKFEGMSAHDAVKVLQLETGVGCEVLMIDLDGLQVPYRIPKSIAFGSMDQTEFERLTRALAHHVGTKYLHSVTEDEVLEICQKILDGEASI